MPARWAAAFTTCQIAFGVMLFAPNLAESTYPAEDPAGPNSSGLRPPVDSSLRPYGDRNCADVPPFADEIGDNPMFL
jgi:hypothetical protein